MTVALLALWLGCAPGSHAQQTQQASSEEQLIPWYYSAVFGTGVYTSGDRIVSVLQIPFAYQLKALTEDEWGLKEDQWGLKVVAPVSFGFYDFRFSELVDGETPKGVGTASIFPGVEAQIPVTRNWRVKPYANVGWGWDLSDGGGALIYAGGVKSLVWAPIGKDSIVSVGNQLTLAGYSPEGGTNQPIGVFVAGLNLETPTDMRVLDRPIIVGGHLIYYYYFKRLRFPTNNDVQNKIEEQGEIAFSLSVKKAIDFNLFDLDRIGLGFRFGGGVQGVSLFFSLPY
ncbi:MAG TPA: hypothetical protein VMH26_04465 [Burkholderiales bacterium]|nr:hypothetical protein [Burkholderiales bacterium]